MDESGVGAFPLMGYARARARLMLTNMYARDDEYRRTHQVQELQEGEVLIDNWVAERRSVFSAGGMLNLTNQRVLWDSATTPLPFIEDATDVFGGKPVGKLITKFADAVGSARSIAIDLGDLASVEPLPSSGLRLTKRSRDSWDFTILAHHWGRRGTDGAVAARNDAVSDISRAIEGGVLEPRATALGGLPPIPPTPSYPTPASQNLGEQLDDGLPLQLAEAQRTGQVVTVVQVGPLRMYVTPDASFRMAVNYPPPAAHDGTQPADLQGVWLMDFMQPPQGLGLRADGTLDGLVQQFGALPAKPLTGQWWWEHLYSRLTLAYVWSVPASEFTYELGRSGYKTFACEIGFAVRLTYVGPNTLVGVTDLDGEELTLRRATPEPSGSSAGWYDARWFTRQV